VIYEIIKRIFGSLRIIYEIDIGHLGYISYLKKNSKIFRIKCSMLNFFSNLNHEFVTVCKVLEKHIIRQVLKYSLNQASIYQGGETPYGLTKNKGYK